MCLIVFVLRYQAECSRKKYVVSGNGRGRHIRKPHGLDFAEAAVEWLVLPAVSLVRQVAPLVQGPPWLMCADTVGCPIMVTLPFQDDWDSHEPF